MSRIWNGVIRTSFTFTSFKKKLSLVFTKQNNENSIKFKTLEVSENFLSPFLNRRDSVREFTIVLAL